MSATLRTPMLFTEEASDGAREPRGRPAPPLPLRPRLLANGLSRTAMPPRSDTGRVAATAPRGGSALCVSDGLAPVDVAALRLAYDASRDATDDATAPLSAPRCAGGARCGLCTSAPWRPTSGRRFHILWVTVTCFGCTLTAHSTRQPARRRADQHETACPAFAVRTQDTQASPAVASDLRT